MVDKSPEIERLKKENEHLRDTEARYRALNENIPLGLYRRTCGPQGKMVMVNPALVKMFGYTSPSELNQISVSSLYFYPEECEDFSKKLFAHGDVIKERLKMKKKDGEPLWVAVTATVVGDASGNPAYFDGIMEDITDLIVAQEQEKFRQQELIQADKMISLGVLVSGVAHEINNPNQFIVSHLAALKKSWSDSLPILEQYYRENGDFMMGGQKYSLRKDRIADMFKNIEEGAGRIKHIVDELRDYAREQPADLTHLVNINKVVESSLSLLSSLIKKSTSAFYVTYEKNMPLVKGNFQSLEQVVINLIQNACQAFETDGGEISVISSHDAKEGAVCFQVNDTGTGISEEDMKRITVPFFTTKRGSGGTGLGLSICETIVSRHGGRLTFSSTKGEGTTVKMFLPVSNGV